MIYISAQSRKSSFRKIQIFEFAYSALALSQFILCLGFKIITASSFIYGKCQRIGRDWLHIVTVFEELVSQNTDFRICIFAVFIP